MDTVLIVDDNAQNLTVLGERLSDHYRVRAANAGPAALQAVARGPLPDLILLDVMMPGRSGQEVIELLQAVEDSVLDQMAVLDRNGRITAVNEPWRRFGLENAGPQPPHGGEAVGQDCLAACGSDPEGICVAERLRGVLDGRAARFRHEYPCHGPGGSRWFQLEATPLRTAAGGAVVVHSDISEGRRAQEELNCHRHRLQEHADIHGRRPNGRMP